MLGDQNALSPLCLCKSLPLFSSDPMLLQEVFSTAHRTRAPSRTHTHCILTALAHNSFILQGCLIVWEYGPKMMTT